jgi:hypothetical protein
LWTSKKALTLLYGINCVGIARHIKNILKDSESKKNNKKMQTQEVKL